MPRAHVVDRVTVLKDTGRAVDDHVELATDVPLLDDRGAGRYANLARHACHAFEVARTESREQRETLDRGRIHTWRSEPALVQARIAVVLDHGRRRRRVVHRRGLEMLKHRLDVFPARRVVEDAQPDRETAAQFRRGDEADRATREKANQLGIQPLAAVLVVVAEASAEAEHAERRGTHELERRAALDALMRPQCEIEAAVDRDAERRQTEILDRQPDLDRVRCPRELHPVVGEVHLSRHRALRVSQVVRMDLERVEELPSLADEETAAFEGLVEPLVRIERDRVGELDARESGAAALGDRGEPAIRAVDVEPRATLAADRGDLGQRIDGTGAGGSGGRGDEEWFAAGARVRVHRGAQCFGTKPVAIVDRQHAYLVRPESQDARGAREGRVCLVRAVDNEPIRHRADERLARARERCHVRRGAAAGEHSARVGRITDPVFEPVEDDQLELARAGRQSPRADVDVESARDQIAERGWPGPAARDVREVARVLVARHERKDVCLETCEELIERTRLLGSPLVQTRRQLLRRERGDHRRRVPRASQAVFDQVDGVPPKLAHRLGVEPEGTAIHVSAPRWRPSPSRPARAAGSCPTRCAAPCR